MTQIKQMGTDYLFKEETEGIIRAFYDVYNSLGFGFLERVYQNALYFELCHRGYTCAVQQRINVYYRGNLVGEYFADIIVNGHIILELKATESLNDEHELQLLNYLKATEIEVGLLLNFGKHPQVKRKIFTNNNKENLCPSVQSVSSACHNEANNN